MKNKLQLAFVAIAGCVSIALSQETATLEGTVRDLENREPLPACNVLLENTGLGATTDMQGNFKLANVPYGKIIVTARYVGYHPQSISMILAQPTARVDFRLSPRILPGPDILVVATRAKAGETPVAFATLSNQDIKTRYFAQDIPAILSELPSTTFYSENGNGIGYNYLSIRGFDQRRISVLINGVPQNDPEDHNVYWIDFPDLLANVADVQVQRGAGSAFYGPPAIGGSVNIVTSSFSNDQNVSVYVGRGSYNTKKFSLALQSPLWRNKYVVTARASRIQSDGYREQARVDLKNYFVSAIRQGENSITRLNFYGGPIEDHLAYAGIAKTQAQQPNTRRSNPIRRPDEIENFNQPHLELINEYRISDHLRLTNTMFGVRGYGFFDYDGSWAPLSYFRLTPENGFAVSGDPEAIYVDSLLIRAYVDNRQLGWLPQMMWTHGRGELVVGGEFRQHRSLHWGRIQKGDSDLPRASSGEYRGRNHIGQRRYYEYRGAKTILSPYLHAAYSPRKNLSLQFDLQLAYLRYRLYDEKFIGTDFARPYYFLNPRAGIYYRLRENFDMFASFSRTSREPRLKNFYDAAEASTPASWGAVLPQFESNPAGEFAFDKPLVKPETLNDYEFGLICERNGWRASMNFFYMDFKNEIIKSGQLDRFGQPVTGNAERTLHAGIELAGRAQIFPELRLSGNLMLSQNELKKYAVYASDGARQILDGNPVAGFPNTLANLRLTLDEAGLTTSLAVQHVGKKYTDNFKNEPNVVDAYTVCNGVLGYSFVRRSTLAGLSLQLHLQNLFNKLYIAHGEGDDFFPAAERQVFVNLKYER